MTNLLIAYPDIPEESTLEVSESGLLESVAYGDLSRGFRLENKSTDATTFNWDRGSAQSANHFGILNAKALQNGQVTSLVLRASDVSAFTPDSISGLVAWYDAGRGIAKDGSNLVSQWNDLSGNGHHLTASGAARPVHTQPSATYNGNHAVTFNTDDYMTADSVAAEFTGDDHPMTLAVALKLDATSGNQCFCGFGDNSTAQPYFFFWNIDANRWSSRRGSSGSSVNVSYSTCTTAYESRTVVFNGTAIDHYVNSALVNSGTPFNVVTTTLNRFTVGALSSFAVLQYYLNGQISELILFDSALAGADLTAVNNYLTAKHSAPRVANYALNSATLKNSNFLEAVTGDAKRHWWVTMGAVPSSRYTHSMQLLGNYLDLGRDPIWGRTVESVSNQAQERKRKNGYSFRWEGLPLSTIESFIAKIVDKAGYTVFALVTDSYHSVLLDKQVVAVYLEDWSMEALSHNNYALEAEFIEAA